MPSEPTPVSPKMELGLSVGSYIVVLKSGTAPGSAKHVFTHVFNGYSANLNDQAVEALRHNPNVEMVEPDRIITLESASWGADRINQRSLPLDGSDATQYSGQGVTVYDLDTGGRPTHQDFTGRASVAYDTFGGNGIDCNGHGTHTLGTIGGSTFGVAKQATLKIVKVFPDCSSSTPSSEIIEGMDWVAQNAVHPAVVNMSLGGPDEAAMIAAVKGLTDKGIVVVVAAGNSAGDACIQSPANAPTAITVGATTSTDARASYSNFGTCVDLFAPGSSITSAWYTADDASNTISGTSMATPHVSGVAALILSEHPGFTSSQVDSAIKARSTKGVVTDARSLNFHLVYSGTDDDLSTPIPPPLPPAPPAPSNVGHDFLYLDGVYGTIRIRWTDNSTDEDGFSVRGQKGPSTFSTTGIPPNSESVTVPLPPGVWTVWVSARNAGGTTESGPHDICVPAFIGDCGTVNDPPLAPSNFRVSVYLKDSPEPDWSFLLLQWKDNSDNEGAFEFRGHNTVSGLTASGWANANDTVDAIAVTEGPWVIEMRSSGPGGASQWVSATICVPGSHYPCDAPPTPPDTTITPPDTIPTPPVCRPRGRSGKCK